MARGFGEIFRFIDDLAGLNEFERSFHKIYTILIKGVN